LPRWTDAGLPSAAAGGRNAPGGGAFGGHGLVRSNIELSDDALGFVSAMELNPQKARIPLRMGLTKTKDVGQIQRYFGEY